MAKRQFLNPRPKRFNQKLRPLFRVLAKGDKNYENRTNIFGCNIKVLYSYLNDT